MPRIYEDKTLARICVRLWADDCEFLRNLSRARELGLNLLIRQIIHSYVAHVKDREHQELNKLDDIKPLDAIDLENLELDFEEEPQPEPEPKGQVIDITL